MLTKERPAYVIEIVLLSSLIVDIVLFAGWRAFNSHSITFRILILSIFVRARNRLLCEDSEQMESLLKGRCQGSYLIHLKIQRDDHNNEIRDEEIG